MLQLNKFMVDNNNISFSIVNMIVLLMEIIIY